MEMKNPVHPGLLVKECLDDLGLSVAETATGLGIRANTFIRSLPKRGVLLQKWRFV